MIEFLPAYILIVIVAVLVPKIMAKTNTLRAAKEELEDLKQIIRCREDALSTIRSRYETIRCRVAECKFGEDEWEFYEDRRGDHRWRRRAANGEIVAASTEGYKNPSDCMGNALRCGYGLGTMPFTQ